MIEREQARAVAEAHALSTGSGFGIREVRLLEEVGRGPTLYNGPDLTRCWIAYVETRRHWLGPSTVILVDRITGDVLYAGSANDEG